MFIVAAITRIVNTFKVKIEHVFYNDMINGRFYRWYYVYDDKISTMLYAQQLRLHQF